jgi:MFS family permease
MKNTKLKIFINYVAGPVLFSWLALSVIGQIKQQPDLATSWTRIKESVFSYEVWTLILVFILMFLNWGLEAFKWRISVRSVQQISFFTALRAVLSGVSFSVTTPNRIGEYFGRVLYLREGNRLRVISLTMVCSLSQLIITILAGLVSLWVLEDRLVASGISGWPAWITMVLTGSILVLVFLTVLYFRLNRLAVWIDKLPWIKKYSWLIKELEKIDATLLFRLLSVSFLRYLIFIIQYILVIRFFGIEIGWWPCFWSMALVFLVMTIIPNIALFEIVQKVFVAEKVLGIFTTNTLGIGLATTTIWMINLLIPAAIGSLLIFGIKIFKKENENT